MEMSNKYSQISARSVSYYPPSMADAEPHTTSTTPACSVNKGVKTRMTEDDYKLLKDSKKLRRLLLITPRCDPDRVEYHRENIMISAAFIGFVAAVLFIFHCIVWTAGLNAKWWNWDLARPYLLSIMIVLAAVAILLFITEMNIKRMTEVAKSVAAQIKNCCGVALPKIRARDYRICVRWVKMYVRDKETIDSINDPVMQMSRHKMLLDDKLYLFYMVSLRDEAKEIKTYTPFCDQLSRSMKDCNLNRLRFEEATSVDYVTRIERLKSDIRNCNMKSVVKRFDDVQHMGTRNAIFFTSIDKLRDKLSALRGIYYEARIAIDGLTEIEPKINYILEYVRLCAFKNTFLAVELINYIRDNGVIGLYKVDDTICIDDTLLDFNADFKFEQDDSDVRFDFAATINDVTKNVCDTVEFICDNEFAQKIAGDHPGLAVAATAIAACAGIIDNVSNYFKERSYTIEKLNQAEVEMIGNIAEIIDAYTISEASIIRAFEIIQAIAKANRGFMQIYIPISEKVFRNDDLSSVTVIDFQQLMKATKEYNKIATSKL